MNFVDDSLMLRCQKVGYVLCALCSRVTLENSAYLAHPLYLINPSSEALTLAQKEME